MKLPCLNCGKVWSVSKAHKGIIERCYFCKDKLKKEYKASPYLFDVEKEPLIDPEENEEMGEDNEPKRRRRVKRDTL
jgi:hypothetical protein